jgi:hypothetical protein
MLKVVLTVCLLFVGVAVLLAVGFMLAQPRFDETIVLTTTDGEGRSFERVLIPRYSNDKLYASANHWPRDWYHRALKNPDVIVTIEGVSTEYRAVSVAGVEHERVDADNPRGVLFHALTGFAPRRFLRLEPR